MSLYTEIQQAIEDVLNAHGIDTDEAEHLPLTLDEWKSRKPSLQQDFHDMLQAKATELRGEH